MRWERGEQLALLVGVAALIVAGVVLIVVRRPSPPVRVFDPPTPTEIVVQLDGAVRQPGLYRLAPGSRLADLLQRAGGAAPAADLTAVNGARLLHDGERIVIPARGLPGQGDAASGHSEGGAGPVNINTASVGELETLPGIGPVLARRITEYRASHGPYRRLEDLLQVQGIGQGLLRRLRGAVTF